MNEIDLISLPTPGKETYESLFEVAEEYSNNLSVLNLKAEEAIRSDYVTYSRAGHSRSHIKFFDPIELEDRYTMYVGLRWSRKTISQVNLVTALVKTFDLSCGSKDLKLGMIWTDNADNPGPRLACFTDFFCELLEMSESEFFLDAVKSGYTSSTSNSCYAYY